jgi:hypothetical protein
MSLIDLSDFLGPSVVAQEVTHKGKTRTFHFKELSADEVESLFIGVDSDPKKNKGLRNRILAKTVCTEAGELAYSEAETGALPNDLANKLQSAALDVNGLSAKAAEEAKNE